MRGLRPRKYPERYAQRRPSAVSTNFAPHRHRCFRQVEEEKAHVRELEALKKNLEGEAEDLQNQVCTLKKRGGARVWSRSPGGRSATRSRSRLRETASRPQPAQKQRRSVLTTRKKWHFFPSQRKITWKNTPIHRNRSVGPRKKKLLRGTIYSK